MTIIRNGTKSAIVRSVIPNSNPIQSECGYYELELLVVFSPKIRKSSS